MKNFFEYLPENIVQPCPKCGKHPVQMRHVKHYSLPYAVCCGGEGCSFYQAGRTEGEAIKVWNNANADTPFQKVTTSPCDKVKTVEPFAIGYRAVVGTVTLPYSTCGNCSFRKENCSSLPKECIECGFLDERNLPYTTEMPVFEELPEMK